MKILFDGVALIDDVIEARECRDRTRGLLGRDSLPAGTAMLISPCSSIHTFFMKFPLDLIFMDRQNRVVKVCRRIKPWRMAWGGFSAYQVLELQAGLINLMLVQEGAQAELSG